MSNEAIKAMQKELDKARSETIKQRKQLLIFQSVQQELNTAKEQIVELTKRLTTDVDEAKTASTLRAKEQIEELRTENARLEAELAANSALLQQTGDEIKEMVQRVTQAESHMKQMAEEHRPAAPTKTYKRDRIRRSQR